MNFYISIFPVSSIDHKASSTVDWPGGKAGDVIVIDFVLAGQRYQALNGGPNENARFNESISLSVTCEDQTEIDPYWEEAVGAGRSRTQADPSESASGIRPPHTLKK